MCIRDSSCEGVSPPGTGFDSRAPRPRSHGGLRAAPSSLSASLPPEEGQDLRPGCTCRPRGQGKDFEKGGHAS
eukprot:2407642-Alexandrium_andersonii.AAC.1